ncbi:hypothetical protein LCGC14_1240950 [marine sediment metagenome]|uniref:Uncharacterized protein n=1 Tax=marine sediment metagenome TaxID=412755 RepID=A0A0F9NN12_9ZZZZ
MVEECVCGHYRADHDLNADWCKRCECVKFRLGRLVDIHLVLRNLVQFCKAAQMNFRELDEADKALTPGGD